LKDVLFTAGSLKTDFVKIFVSKARELIHPERGCLAIVVDAFDISSVSTILKTFFRMHHNIVVGIMSPAKTDDGDRDMRYQGYFQVRVCLEVTMNVCEFHT
jgi:tRNA threonylcarbamoyladenosine modification (KEOPS) complex  Pcc1 subunit